MWLRVVNSWFGLGVFHFVDGKSWLYCDTHNWEKFPTNWKSHRIEDGVHILSNGVTKLTCELLTEIEARRIIIGEKMAW